jgi:hypothetical protein
MFRFEVRGTFRFEGGRHAGPRRVVDAGAAKCGTARVRPPLASASGASVVRPSIGVCFVRPPSDSPEDPRKPGSTNPRGHGREAVAAGRPHATAHWPPGMIGTVRRERVVVEDRFREIRFEQFVLKYRPSID